MTIEITPELQELIKALAVPDFKIPDLIGTEPLPAIATIRELDIGITAGKYDAKYLGSKTEVDVTAYPGGLEEVLRKVQDGSLALTDDAKPMPPFKTPMCIHNKKHCYIIIKLSNVNWQFSNNRPPLSIGLKGWVADVYRHARRADEQGAEVQPNDVQNRCMIAYVIADGLTASGGNPANPIPYDHAFNLHVDLVAKDSNGNPAYIPITIDPDIRYPGGSA